MGKGAIHRFMLSVPIPGTIRQKPQKSRYSPHRTRSRDVLDLAGKRQPARSNPTAAPTSPPKPMYRPALATWFESIAQRLPLKTIPATEQVEIAKQITGQPDVPWCRISSRTAYTLVWSQATEVPIANVPGLAQELMAAMTWNREMVMPDPIRLARVAAHPCLPRGALHELAKIPRQTNYILLEHTFGDDPDLFINGAWLIADIDHDGGDRKLLLQLDLIRQGTALRDIVMSYDLCETVEEAIERQVDREAITQGWDSMPGGIGQRESLRAYIAAATPILAVFYDTFVKDHDALARARTVARADELDFKLVDIGNPSGTATQHASGIRYH